MGLKGLNSMKSNKGKIIAAIIVLCIILGISVFFFLGPNVFSSDNTGSKQNLEKLEKYEDDTREWEYKLDDLTGKYSQEETDTIQDEVCDAIETFNSLIFNFDDSTKDYTDRIYSLYVPKDVKGSNRGLQASTYKDFKDIHTESSYDYFTPYTFVINSDRDVPTVVVHGLSHMNFKADNIKKGDYDVESFLVLEKIDGKWLMYRARYQNIFEAGSVKAYLSNNDNTLSFVGNRIGWFDSSY